MYYITWTCFPDGPNNICACAILQQFLITAYLNCLTSDTIKGQTSIKHVYTPNYNFDLIKFVDNVTIYLKLSVFIQNIS